MKDETLINMSSMDQKTMDILVANIVPPTKYFETRFDHMEHFIGDIKSDLYEVKSNLKEYKKDTDKRFDDIKHDNDRRLDDFKQDIDRRFDHVYKHISDFKADTDKRFDIVGKNFEQVDKRFEQVLSSIEKLGEKFDNRDDKQRTFTIKMFSIAITISMFGVVGAFLKSFGVI